VVDEFEFKIEANTKRVGKMPTIAKIVAAITKKNRGINQNQFRRNSFDFTRRIYFLLEKIAIGFRHSNLTFVILKQTE
jgi:hypothetical protein